MKKLIKALMDSVFMEVLLLFFVFPDIPFLYYGVLYLIFGGTFFSGILGLIGNCVMIIGFISWRDSRHIKRYPKEID